MVIPIGAHEITIPALPAASWLEILGTLPIELEDIFPGLADAEEFIDDALFEELLTVADVEQLALEAIAIASARPWYVAVRLIHFAFSGWNVIGGDVVIHQVDANRLSFAAWLDAIHLILLRHLKPESVTMFHSQLELPPPGVQVSPQEMEMPRDQFLSMMSG